MIRALISDIHSNLESLEAVLADIREQGITQIYCLGDIVGYGPDPCQCIDRIMQCDVCLLGNHVQGALFDPEGFNTGAERAIFWTREQLENPKGNPSENARRWDFLGELTEVLSNLDRQDSTFRFIPGLADSKCITFESLNYPGYYLRHWDFRIKLHSWEDSQLFREDTTFCERPGLADPDLVSFESHNYPGYYLRHRDFHLYIEQGDSDLFRADVTFRIVEPLGR